MQILDREGSCESGDDHEQQSRYAKECCRLHGGSQSTATGRHAGGDKVQRFFMAHRAQALGMINMTRQLHLCVSHAGIADCQPE